MSDTISARIVTPSNNVDHWLIQELVDRQVIEADQKHRREVADGLKCRDEIRHAFGRRPNGQRRGFGNGERCNSKRRRWAAKRQRAARTCIKNQHFNIFESNGVEELD